MVESFYESAGVVNRSNRGKLKFAGEQSLWFLDQLLTNSLEGLGLDESAEALLLSPKGKITDHVRLLNAGGAVYADVEMGRAEPLKSFFDGRVFMTRVEISNVSEDFGLLEVLGPDSGRAVSAVGLPEETLTLQVERPVPGVAIWIHRAELGDTIAALIAAGAVVVEQSDYETIRIIEGLPSLSDCEGHLPQEAALEYLVHFSKGCYLGQESVAMAQRGTVKKRLRHLVFERGSSTGQILFEEKKVGVVTSAAEQQGVARGIGMVGTSVPLGSEVLVERDSEQLKALVRPLPGTIEGPKLPSARELRERLQGRG